MTETRDETREEMPLGTCPVCTTMIPAARLLIRYESEDGWPRLFAECPRCTVPVHPE